MDPATFLSQAVSGALSTKRIAHPAGEYFATIKEISYKTMDSKKEPGKVFHILDVVFKTDDALAKEQTGMNEPTVRKSIFLDLLPDGSALDTSNGKNVDLGRLRAAVGQNDPEKSWTFNDLVGQQCYIIVNHNVEGEDTYANVGKVGAAASS